MFSVPPDFEVPLTIRTKKAVSLDPADPPMPPLRRLIGRFSLGVQAAPPIWPCIVDTGSSLSIFPENVWTSHVKQIDFKPKKELPLRVLGQEIPASEWHLGDIVISLYGNDGRAILSRMLRAAFVEPSNVGLKESVLGITGGLMDLGGLCLNFKDDCCVLVAYR